MDAHRAGRNRTRGVVVAGIALVALLGNMRLAISQTSLEGSHPAEAAGAVSGTFAVGRVERTPSVIPVDSASEGHFTSDALRDSDVASLVPAIFAWDPDVRFVYFRHVSKWM